MPKAPYTLSEPAHRTSSVVFASPHSGREYPAPFLRASVLDEMAIRSSEDAFVDVLFGEAPAVGAPLICANVPRAYVDLNRNADELDPALIEGVKRGAHNPRVNSGLGVVPRVVAGGRAIYRGKISQKDAQGRLVQAWHPYHDRLQRLLDESHFLFGSAILIDLHSMPHEAIEGIKRAGASQADVVLGDRFGAAAHHDVVDQVEAAFAGVGLTVARNAPFAGAYITQHYGRPARNQHVIQVEIDRGLYMDESKIAPNACFDDFRRLMTQVMRDVAEIGRDHAALAAE
ncbi:MAG: N-formylglutamate amidohydrolase [Pseudomonadota bacterium]